MKWNLDDHANAAKFESGCALLQEYCEFGPFLVNNGAAMQAARGDPAREEYFRSRCRAQRRILLHRQGLLERVQALEVQLRAAGYQEMADRLMQRLRRCLQQE